MIICLYSEDGVFGYVRIYKVVYEVLKKMLMLDIDFIDKIECIFVVIYVFYFVSELECNYLNESGYVCVMLCRIIFYCKVLYVIFFNMFVVKDVLLKELIFFFLFESFVLWFCLIVFLCCDFSILLCVIFFFELVCDFIYYISSMWEGDLVKVGVFVVYGRVLLMLC